MGQVYVLLLIGPRLLQRILNRVPIRSRVEVMTVGVRDLCHCGQLLSPSHIEGIVDLLVTDLCDGLTVCGGAAALGHHLVLVQAVS